MADDDFFAPPPFDAAAALQGLKRQLRELRLAERGEAFELKGQPVVALAIADGAIDARLVKRPARSPEWLRHRLCGAADARRFVETVKGQLARWDDEGS